LYPRPYSQRQQEKVITNATAVAYAHLSNNME
jgi:hypothetical protein